MPKQKIAGGEFAGRPASKSLKMDPMRGPWRLLTLLGSIAAFSIIAAGPWGALQTVAWARMIVNYTQDSGSLRQGLAETFDGAHPCALCRQIKVGIAKEQTGEHRLPAGKERPGKVPLVAVLPAAFSAPFARDGVRLPAPVEPCGGRLADAPPVPPPRVGRAV